MTCWNNRHHFSGKWPSSPTCISAGSSASRTCTLFLALSCCYSFPENKKKHEQLVFLAMNCYNFSIIFHPTEGRWHQAWLQTTKYWGTGWNTAYSLDIRYKQSWPKAAVSPLLDLKVSHSNGSGLKVRKMSPPKCFKGIGLAIAYSLNMQKLQIYTGIKIVNNCARLSSTSGKL